MENIYLYNTKLDIGGTPQLITVAFIYHQPFDRESFFSQLKVYFQQHVIPDRLIIVAAQYLLSDPGFPNEKNAALFKEVIPTKYFQENLYEKFASIYSFDKNGHLSLVRGPVVTQKQFDELFRMGLTKIFNKGGLITAHEAHHFVFPSGKHCNSFLRTGNVLIKSHDIFFIALNCLKYYKENYSIIYCDTSSINSLAFALVELKRRLDSNHTAPHIESYGSYAGFETANFENAHKALFLISSSTSANIIDRLKEKLIDENRIALVFCLKPERYQHLVVCDIVKDEQNPEGIEPFESYAFNEPCVHCARGSMAVKVQGDVFLLEKPSINKVIIGMADAPKGLSAFVEKYHKGKNRDKQFFKCNFYESSSSSSASSMYAYELFFDIESVFKDIQGTSTVYPKFKENLDHAINRYVPSTTEFIIYLNDAGSFEFANYLSAKLKDLIKQPRVLPLDKLHEIPNDAAGAAVIVSSSIVSGGNAIYASKELRRCENLSLIYLIGFARTDREETLKFISSNLCQGKLFGASTNPFHCIETIHCNVDYKNTAWQVEEIFVGNLLGYCQEYVENPEKVINFFRDRLNILSESRKMESKGFADNIFYGNIFTGAPLTINKNFAFFDFHDYDQYATQADIYFTISSVINNLRHTKNVKHCLKQTEYARNVIDPQNFNRYNDGIIQASILRAAKPLELAYDLDIELSREFLNVVVPYLIHADDGYGEALLEFLYSIAIRKLKLEVSVLQELMLKTTERCSDQPVIMAICQYIRAILIDKDKNVIKNYLPMFETI